MIIRLSIAYAIGFVIALVFCDCAHGYRSNIREQHACTIACTHFAGEVGRRHLQASWPVSELQCARRFDDESTEICTKKKHRDDTTPLCE